jgi:hypothetical protein
MIVSIDIIAESTVLAARTDIPCRSSGIFYNFAAWIVVDSLGISIFLFVILHNSLPSLSDGASYA